MTITSYPSKLTLEKWFLENKPEGDYAQTTIVLNRLSGIKYSSDQEKDLSYFVYLKNNDTILEIKAEAKEGRNLYEPVFDQILKTINFTK